MGVGVGVGMGVGGDGGGDLDGEGEDGFGIGYLEGVPPPSYDSIDFSRPPLKQSNELEIT